MPEDDYTGNPIGDDVDIDLPADVDLYEFDADDEALADEFASLEENEQTIHFAEVANGTKSLRDAAEALHDFADELFAMADEGWELVDDVTNGHAVAVRFGVDDEEDEIFVG